MSISEITQYCLFRLASASETRLIIFYINSEPKSPRLPVEAIMPSLILPLSILSLLLIQPILIGIYAKKGFLGGMPWVLLVLGTNIGIVALFESRTPARFNIDVAAEVGTAIFISSMVAVCSLITLSGGPHREATGDLTINYRRGIFRISVIVSGVWIIHCMIEFLQTCNNYGCNFFTHGHYFVLPGHVEIGEWFLRVPVVAFVIGQGVCWAIDGFQRPQRQNRAETVLLLIDVVGPPVQSEQE
jgi:hypothetical protein